MNMEWNQYLNQDNKADNQMKSKILHHYMLDIFDNIFYYLYISTKYSETKEYLLYKLYY